MISFRVEGEPVGKGRPRVIASRGKFAHAYTPKKTKDYEDSVRFAFMAVTEETMPLYLRGASLEARMTIAVSVPKSYSKKKRALCLEGHIAPSKKPDIDNVIKCILDALNGYAFEDDSQVVKLKAEKIYAETPYVDVWLEELTDEQEEHRGIASNPA